MVTGYLRMATRALGGVMLMAEGDRLVERYPFAAYSADCHVHELSQADLDRQRHA